MGASYSYVNVDQGSVHNLRALLERADEIDWLEGQCAYVRYQSMMGALASKYDFTTAQVIAAFVSLSPNNDYVGNLRSLVSVLDGIRRGVPEREIKTSSYHHCRKRAYEYATGKVEFLDRTKGPKICSFYLNILNPLDRMPVTIDGHMVCAWMGQRLTMKNALVRGARAYETIADGVRLIAYERGLIANQVQSVIWFARKRVDRVKYDPQVDIFDYADQNVWRTVFNIDQLKPYA